MQIPTVTYDINELRTLNILLAEDNLLNVKLISILFAQKGIPLQVAENGLEAIQKMKNNSFDIILMDMEMPLMSGYEATVVIRQELKNNIPIIAMTAHATPSEIEKCLQLGMNAHFQKPADADQLFTCIHDLVYNPNAYARKNLVYHDSRDTTRIEKLYDFSYLNNVTGGNKKVISNIVDVFLQQATEELLALRNAIKKTNYGAIRDIAHKIKSSFLLVGISAVDPEFQEMERLGVLSSGIEEIERLSRRVNSVFNQARIEMEESARGDTVNSELVY